MFRNKHEIKQNKIEQTIKNVAPEPPRVLVVLENQSIIKIN